VKSGRTRDKTETHIINNVTVLFEVDWVDDYGTQVNICFLRDQRYVVITFIISIFLIAIEVLGLSSMTGIYFGVSYKQVKMSMKISAHNGRTVSHWDLHHERATPLHATIGPIC
jgi:hypothetical protein